MGIREIGLDAERCVNGGAGAMLTLNLFLDRVSIHARIAEHVSEGDMCLDERRFELNRLFEVGDRCAVFESEAEVLAVEIKQYASEKELRTLVPRVIGQTAQALHKRSQGVPKTRQWNETTWFEELTRRVADYEDILARPARQR